MDHDVKDLSLAAEGKKRSDWAGRDMPVLELIKQRFEKEKPFKGLKMSACLHVTAETANLCRTIKAGGAELLLCASNPLSTQDDVAASLVADDEISVHAITGEDNDTYYKHIRSALDFKPDVTMDDGADLVSTLHNEYPDDCANVLASMEETTTGVIRLRAMADDGALKIPVIAVNDADCKHFFDNRYGTGQSTLEGVIRATGGLIAGKKFVVSGYGWCGRGVADRARGLGAHVIVTEVLPLRALQAAMDGFPVMPMADAVPVGDIFVTVTGDISVIRLEHMEKMKDGAVVANSGHFNVEIDLDDLEKAADKINKDINKSVDEYVLKGGKRIYILGEGRLVNLAAAEGHPASVMDMSFAVQALTAEWAVKNKGKLGIEVLPVPREIDEQVAALKLKAMGIDIDVLTAKQKEYLSSWQIGT